MDAPLKVRQDASPTNGGATSYAVPSGGNKRIKLSIESLKRRKIVAGDWVRVTREESDNEFVLAQAWPTSSPSSEYAELSPTHFTSLHSPSKILIHPTDVSTYKIAKSVELERVGDDYQKGQEQGDEVTREEVWNLAVLKELLLDLAYITLFTTISIPSSSTQSSTNPSSRPRTYRVVNVIESTVATGTITGKGINAGARALEKRKKVGEEGLDGKMSGLSIDGGSNGDGDIVNGGAGDIADQRREKESKAWTMHWKTQISIVESSDTIQQDQPGTATTTQDPKLPANSSNRPRLSQPELDSSALPSSISIFPPGPLHSSSESYTAYASLGGLAPQISQIRSLLELPLARPEIYSRFGLKPPRGILLYGPPGTGKTHLARAIASSTPGCSCIVVNGPELSSAYHGETEERLRAVFVEARKREPCIVVLDEVDALCPRREEGGGGEVEKRVVATLLTLMDGMANGHGAGSAQTGSGEGKGGEDGTPERVVVIAATNRPNAIDPALRRPGRFDREIEIGIPSAAARLDILLILISKMPHGIQKEELEVVARSTHGYVGADLSSLVREAGSLAIRRWLGESTTSEVVGEPRLLITDITTALPSIRPSAMREVFIETPNVRWSDIGGQSVIKQKLAECVEWPLLHADTFERLGVTPPRGVLLYGPPGCSKTLVAKALATESGVNFMAVKGPELLNKFVGESERAVREVFRKARAAAPAIIFFDEIDAMAISRDTDGHTSGVLTTLLNEMDGVEAQSNVIVVAATNRPDVLDSALLRPGRLDRILYVGPPDLKAREEIFTIRLAKMATESSVDIAGLALMTDGCSGAELASICQDAALAAMNEDVKAEMVLNRHFDHAAKTVRRRITLEMVRGYERWSDAAGVRGV